MSTKQQSLAPECPEQTKNNDTLGYKYRKATSADIFKILRDSTTDPKLQELVDVVVLKLKMTCEEISQYIGNIPSKMGVKSAGLSDVFEQIAESIENIPDSPRTATTKACVASYDACRIPDISEEVRRVGYEEGYQDARTNQQTFISDVDIDID